MKKRMSGYAANVVGILIGSAVTLAMLCAIFGCGGPGWLGTGLIIESILDPDESTDSVDGQDGLDCYDLNANGECDEEEDVDGDGDCDAYDCQGVDGVDGVDGEDSTLPGPQGPPGTTTIIVIDDDEGQADGPPFGNAFGHDKPKGKP